MGWRAAGTTSRPNTALQAGTDQGPRPHCTAARRLFLPSKEGSLRNKGTSIRGQTARRDLFVTSWVPTRPGNSS